MKTKTPPPDRFVVVTPEGEVFSGMREGKFIFSKDWSKAKYLEKPNTKYLMRTKGNELINIKDL